MHAEPHIGSVKSTQGHREDCGGGGMYIPYIVRVFGRFGSVEICRLDEALS